MKSICLGLSIVFSLLLLSACTLAIQPADKQIILGFNGLREIKLLVPGELSYFIESAQAQGSVQVSGQVSGPESKDAWLSIRSDRELANRLNISFVNGTLTIASRDQGTMISLADNLEVVLYADKIDLLALQNGFKSGEEPYSHRLNISLQGHGNTKIGRIIAGELHLNMLGHGKLTIDSLESEVLDIKLNGHGKIEFKQLESEAVTIAMKGHGGIKLSGETKSQAIILSGNGAYDAGALSSVDAKLFVRGNARSTLKVSEDLALDVITVENVHIQGKPRISRLAQGKL